VKKIGKSEQFLMIIREFLAEINHLVIIFFTGVKNLDSGVGVYAPDAEAYCMFKELFNPIIQGIH
jgi:hypothetical protein